MLQITKLWMNGGALGRRERCSVSDTLQPLFGWTADSDADNAMQQACRVCVSDGEKQLWDSGWQESAVQRLRYAGEALPLSKALTVKVSVRDTRGEETEAQDVFYYGSRPEWEGKWIAAPGTAPRAVTVYRRVFELEDGWHDACLYLAGIGYHKAYLNGHPVDDSVLDPAHTNYARQVNYAVLPMVNGQLRTGKNVLVVEVADGWRHNDSDFIDQNIGDRTVEFTGRPMLTAVLEYTDAAGAARQLVTDESWQWRASPITMANIFDGEDYDANLSDPDWLGAENAGYRDGVELMDAPGGVMRPMIIDPILQQETYPAIDVFEPEKGVFVADFGQNIAGVLRFELPKGLKKGQKITVSFMEFLNEDGKLYRLPLRGAKQTDTYIASGDERDLLCWMPRFTYHGFRYAEITGLPTVQRSQLVAVALYTDVASGSSFRCGDPLINKIHQNAVQTEKSNIHSILTDCPQRDERMGWMNDATVRFEETPYNFHVGRLFVKVVRDIRAEQRENGAFACCAPFVFGGLPADPVCSSYLVAGAEALRFTGDLGLIDESFDGFAAWEDFLLSQSKDYIVQYSYYGDWASPAYACVGDDGAVSAVTPGILMSTGFSYFNCRTLARMAALLGREEDEKTYAALADSIAASFLKEWWDPETATIATGSEACQAFALWLGLLPEADRARAAKVMRDDLVDRNYQFTTGNLCTRYLLDMLTEYGYLEDAWKLLTSDRYPSYGFMIQNEATTVWERFELKKNAGMNSHNHPMYGSVDRWFYRYLCGICPTSDGFDTVKIEPCYPEGLLSAQAVVDTVHGDVGVKWVRRYGALHLYVHLPFGMTGTVRTPDGTVQVGSGSHQFHWAV